MRKKVTKQNATGTIKAAATKAAETVKNAPISETAEKATFAILSRVTEVTLEIFETNVTMKAIEEAVKKDAADKKLKGEIKIYVNAERRAAYYTVDGEGSEVNKIDLTTL